MDSQNMEEYFVDAFTDEFIEEIDLLDIEAACERVKSERNQKYLQDLIELETESWPESTFPFDAYMRPPNDAMFGYKHPVPNTVSFSDYTNKQQREDKRTVQQIARSVAEKRRKLVATTDILNRLMRATHVYYHKEYLSELELPTQHSCTSILGHHETLRHLAGSAVRRAVSAPNCKPSRWKDQACMFNQSFSEYNLGEQAHYFEDDYWDNLSEEGSLVKDEDVLDYLKMTMSLGIRNNRTSTDFQDFVSSQLNYRETLPTRGPSREVNSEGQFNDTLVDPQICATPFEKYSSEDSWASPSKSPNKNNERNYHSFATDEYDVLLAQDKSTSKEYDNMKSLMSFACGLEENDRDCRNDHGYIHQEFTVDIKYEEQMNEHSYENDSCRSLDFHIKQETTFDIRMTEQRETHNTEFTCNYDAQPHVYPQHVRELQNTSTHVSCANELDEVVQGVESCLCLQRQNQDKTRTNICSSTEIASRADSDLNNNSLHQGDNNVIVVLPVGLPVVESSREEHAPVSLETRRAALDKETEDLIRKAEAHILHVDRVVAATENYLKMFIRSYIMMVLF